MTDIVRSSPWLDVNNGGARMRLLSVVFIVLFASLCVQWLTLVSAIGGGNIKYFHVAGLLFLGLFAVNTKNWAALIGVWRCFWLFGIGVLLYLTLLAFTNAYLDRPYFSMREVIRQWFGVLMCFAVSGFMFRVCLESKSRSGMVWVTIIASGTAAALMLMGVFAAGTNPVSLLADAVTSGDPRILIYGLFRASFIAGDDVELAANVRHGVLSSLLAAFFISLAMYRVTANRASWFKRLSFLVACAGTVFLVVFSLSRSVTIVLLLFACVAAMEWLVVKRAATKLILVAPLIFLALVLTLYSDVGGLLQQRYFEETTSYENRVSAMNQALERINQHPFFPSDSMTYGATSHNLILDAWAGAGMVAVTGAILMFGSILFFWSRQFFEMLLTRNRWRLDIPQSPVLGLGLIALVRFMTAGSGTLHTGEWIALGAFAGCYAANSYACKHGRRTLSDAPDGQDDLNVTNPDHQLVSDS